MSVRPVGSRHVDFVVAAILSHREECPDAPTDPSELGRLLWEANYRSVDDRTGLNLSTPAYTYRDLALPDLKQPVGLFYARHALMSFRAQCSQSREWEISPVRRWINVLWDQIDARLEAAGVDPDASFRDIAGWTVGENYDPEAVLDGRLSIPMTEGYR